MIDIDALEAVTKRMKAVREEASSPAGVNIGKLNAAKQAYDDATDYPAILALIAEVRQVRKAAAFYDVAMGAVQGCSDGGCMIRTPTGMHTNGGCRCARDTMKTQRVLYAAKQLRDAIGGAK